MELQLSTAMSRLGTETAFEVLAKARALEAQGKSVIHLEIGEPDFDTPAHIVEAAKRALDEGYTHYGPAAGLPELREAIAHEIATSRGISVQPDQVVVTPGGKPVMFYAILALCEAGDEVIYPNPGFPIYESMINFVGAKAVPLPLLEEKGFAFSIDDLKSRITPRTKMLVINSPANPTGGIIPPEDLAGNRRAGASSTTSGCSRTRSTAACSTKARTPRSRRSRAWRSARSSSTASPRPTR